MKRLIYILFTLLLLVGCKSKNEIEFSWNPVYNVEVLWKTIDTKYCFVEEKGIDWNAIRSEYVTKAATIKEGDQIALFDLCASMLDSLHDGHVNIYTQFDISRNEAWYNSYPDNFYADQQSEYLKNYRIAGGLQYTTIDNGQVGYVYCPSFSSTISANNIYWIISAFKSTCRGLIIDVRNNGGGDLSNAYRLAAAFTKEDMPVGYWSHKSGPGHRDYSKAEKMTVKAADCPSKWLRPVVVLSNRQAYSATNFFINCMTQVPHATIIGGKSGGGGGMPLSYEMPCGWTVRFSSVKMFDVNMHSIEEGIDPDETVTTLKTYTKDKIIERAIEIIHSKTGG
jgi:hypothetical protein